MPESEKGHNAEGAAHIFAGGGEMGARMRAMDWAKTPLGAVSGWSQSLKTAVGIMLNSRFPMVIWWGNELVLLYNDGWRPILGVNKDKIALGERGEIVWAEIWDVLGPMFAQVLETGEATWNDDGLLLVNRYGYREEAYFTWSYSPIRDDDGKVGGVFTAVTETTRRVVGERRLQTLRDMGRRTAEAATAGEACALAAQTLTQNPQDLPFALVYMLDREGKTAELCETAHIEKGCEASPLKVELGAETDVWGFAKSVAAGGSKVVTELEPKFGARTFSVFGDPLEKAIILPLSKAVSSEGFSGFLVAGLSPNLEFDEDYRSFLDLAAGHLATAIANARALEDERRRTAKLAELDRAKTEFFSNISHEFRTPLTLMLGNLEEAMNGDGGVSRQAQLQQIETAHRNSLRLLKLVNNLLDFSRIEAGRFNVNFEPTDLCRLTEDLASVFRSAIEREGIKFTVECRRENENEEFSDPQSPFFVLVDCEMWEKIVFNLISNAFKFTFSGEIAVTLVEKSETVELTVRDSGVGIPADELPHIFERFHRVRSTQGRTHEGTGIGLSLVQELVRLHGGTIDASSEPGKGTIFTVAIPNRKRAAEESEKEAKEDARNVSQRARNVLQSYLLDSENGHEIETEESPLLPFYSAASVLLADDNADMRGYIRRLLEQNGFRVEAVADGQQALERLSNTDELPDLVITDVMMPQLDGFGLLARLRADERLRTVPVIMLSARAGEEARVEGLDAGADDYLTKPFSARELLARVNSIIELGRMRRAVEVEREKSFTILEGITDAFFAIDRDFRFTYVNRRAEEFMKFTREELIGKDLRETYPVRGTRFLDEYERAFRENVAVEFEILSPISGRWFEVHAHPTTEDLLIFFRDITNRKAADERLRKSEMRFRSVFTGNMVPMGIWTREGGITEANEALLNLIGYTRDELEKGQINWKNLTPPEYEYLDRIALNEIASKTTCTPYEKVYIHKSGRRLPILMGSSRFEDTADAGIFFAIDLTERLRTQEQIAGQNRTLHALAVGQDFRTILESATESIEKILAGARSSVLLADEDGKRLFCGAANALPEEYNAAIDGVSIGEGIGSCGTAAFRRQPVIVSDIACDPLWRDFRDLAAAHGLAACWSHPILAPDGKLLGTFATYFSEPREPNELEVATLEAAAQIAGIAIYRKLTEDALQKSEEHLSAIFAEAQVGLSEISIDGRFLRVNDELCRILGRPREELTKLTITDVTAAEDLPETSQNLKKLLETREPVSFDKRYVRGDGRVFWANSTISLLGKNSDNATILAVTADLSERKESERRIGLLAEIGDLTRRYENADELLFAVSVAVGEHFGARRCLFNEIDLDRDIETVHRDYCRGVESVAGKHKISDYSPITSAEMKAGKTIVNRDSQTDPRTAALYEQIYEPNGERAYVAVPLLRENRWVASLWLSEDKPRDWSAEEVTLLETIAERVWSVVEKLRIDAALRESEERFRKMADHAPVMVWVTDASGFCTYLSKSWYDFTGQTPATGLGFGWLDATHPDDQQRAEEAFLKANEKSGEFKVEYRLRDKNGNYRWAIDSAKPRFDADGEFLGYIGSVTDIDERKQIEEQITYQLNLTQTITDNTQSCLLMMDSEGRGTFANHAAERVTGFKPHELIGEILHHRIHHTHPDGSPFPKEDCPLDNALPLQEAVVGYEDVFVHKDGHFYPVRCSGRPIFKDGKAIGTVIEVQDITEEKRIAEEREQLLLSERIAREEAENANRLKDEFLATVSHELRTPLNAILGWATMARKNGGDGEVISRALEVIERSARNQNQIISDILDVSRIITGKLHLNLEPVRLSRVVQSAIDTVRPSLEAKRIRLETVFESVGEIEMAGDADRVQQIVWNLLSNAVKFTPEDGLVEIGVRYADGFAEITVSDNGEGIAREFLPFVFDRFRQADGRWNRRHGGLGLGLAVVRHLTELHGGTVSVESAGIGQGANFTVRLPLRIFAPAGGGAVHLTADSESLFHNGTDTGRVLENLKILAVDDQRDALDLVKYILAENGASVLTAESVDEALAIFDREAADVIVSDIGMPGRDGYELMSELLARFAGEHYKIPTIALTAYASEKDNERVLLAGFQAFLPKPVEPSQLVETIAGLTYRKRQEKV